jgi:excisionase family DNA binding protein
MSIQENQQKQNSSQELLTLVQTSELLNLKHSKLRSMIFKNEIPVIRIGRCLRFSKVDLTNWLTEKKNYSFGA